MPDRKRGLRAVEANETPVPAAILTILEAAELGDRLEELRAMRRRIAVTLDDPNTPARDLAALSRRQIEISKEIEAILARNAKEGSGVSDVQDGKFDQAAI